MCLSRSYQQWENLHPKGRHPDALTGLQKCIRITKVDPSWTPCRWDVGWFSTSAFHHDTGAPWEANPDGCWCSHLVAGVMWGMCCEVPHVSGFILYLGVKTLQKGCCQLYPCGQQPEKGLCQLICAAALRIKTYFLHCQLFFPLAV